jgi:hypothetical protein
MMGRVKRARQLSALVLAATLTLSGCGGSTLQDGAVINGTSYSVREVQQAAQQLEQVTGQPGDPQSVLYEAAVVPLIEDAFAGSTYAVTDAELRRTLADAGLEEDPGDLTLESARFRHYSAMLQAPETLAEEEMAPVLERLNQVTQEDVNALDVEVNPRFGTWDPANGGVVPQVPEWIQSPGADS